MMLVKRFVPRALMQQHQQTTLVDDFCEVVGSVGYLLLDPTFSSTVANVSMERTLLRDFFFYHHHKMQLKERIIASKITIAIQETLIRGEVYDVRGIGDKIAYSSIYGTSYSWIDIPDIKVEYHHNNGIKSYLMIRPSSSQLTKLQSHEYYLAEINQGLSNEGFTVLSPILSDGWICYRLLSPDYDPRFDFTSSKRMMAELSSFQEGALPLTKDLMLKKLDHMLITARTGYGKTQLSLAISAELGWLDDTILYFLDPKHSDLSTFGRFLGVNRYADTTESIDEKLHALVNLMQKRYEIMRQLSDADPAKYVGGSASDYGFNNIVVVFDEISAHLSASKHCLPDLRRLMMLGRQAGVYLLLILQDPRATGNLPSTIKDQTGIRVALGNLSGTVASLVFGAGTILPAGTRNVGEGYIQLDGGEPMLFEAPAMPNNSRDLYELMKQALKGQELLDPMEHN